MRRLAVLAGILAVLVVGVSVGMRYSRHAEAPLPPPVALTADAIGHYCGMALVEHPGPKGQILLRSSDKPVWFSSARDAIAFTMLAEEAKTIRAIYVSDMARTDNWEQPGAANWVEARLASFVIGSDRRGGMGAPEAVPFSDRKAAERFAAEHGGQIFDFKHIPAEWVLGDDLSPSSAGSREESSPSARHAH